MPLMFCLLKSVVVAGVRLITEALSGVRIPAVAREVKKMTEDKIKAEIMEKAEAIAKALRSGKDIRITTSASGIVIQSMTVKKI